jgi:hypothetical protein
MKLIISIDLCFFLLSCSNPNDSIEDLVANEAEFTLNGGGFNNNSYKLTSYRNTRLNGARYNPSNKITSCSITGENEGSLYGGNSILFAFHGKDTGKYTFTEPSNNSLSLFIKIDKDSVISFCPMRDSTGGSINVTKYPKVGEQIEGSFSVEGIDIQTYDVNKKIKVTGTFKIMRFEDIETF